MSYNDITLEKSSKNYIRCENEPSQDAIHSVPPPPPPLRKLRRRIFHVVRGNVQVAGAEAARQLEGGGRGDLRIDTIW